MWFAAHIITVFKYREPKRAQRQRKFHIWENIVLIEAANAEDGWRKAEAYGSADADHDDPSLRIDGIPMKLEYVAVRKLIEVLDPDKRPKHGTEISYNKLNVSSRADLDRLVAGDPVFVEYEE